MAVPVGIDRIVPAPDVGSRERILTVATALFARHGFDGVSTRAIAQASALNVATVAHHTGSKTQLYVAVFERLHAIEQDLLAEALATLPDGRPTGDRAVADLPATLHHLLDAYVDVLAREPAIAALWARRLIEPRSEHDAVAKRYVEPLLDRLTALLAAARRRGATGRIEPRLVVTTVLWAAYGHIIRSTEWTGTSGSVPAASVRAIRPVLHGLMDHLLGWDRGGGR